MAWLSYLLCKPMVLFHRPLSIVALLIIPLQKNHASRLFLAEMPLV